jgi:hypothetical protein
MAMDQKTLQIAASTLEEARTQAISKMPPGETEVAKRKEHTT